VPTVTTCSLCGKEDLCFKCPYCNGLFCAEHRLPESHGCSELHKVRDDAKKRVSDGLAREVRDRRKPKTKRRRRFSPKEIRDLSIASVLVALVGISLLGRPNGIFSALPLIVNVYIPSGLWWLIAGIMGIFVCTFMVHELAHKFVAQHYGMWSEFRMLQTGYFLSAMAILFSIPIFGTGVVLTSGGRSIKEDGKANLAGPLSNFILALILTVSGLLFALATGNASWELVTLVSYGVEINAFIALFNMIPIQPFDGATIRSWSNIVWVLMTAGLVAMLLVAYFFIPLFPSFV
jgi:Zn-dependent protease